MIKVEDPRFRHLKKKIAIFAAVALAVIAVVILLIGKENDLFTQKYELALTVEKGTGFTRGMPVKLSGFRIGRIKSISLNEAATVDIVLQIDKKYQKWIRKNSTAKLVKEGLVGDSIIEVSVGTPALAVLQENDKLAYVKTKALDELADEIADKVKPVLSDVKDIIGYLNDPNGDIKQSMRNFNLLSRNLELTRERADSLLIKAGNEAGTVSGKLSTVLDDTSATVRRANASLSLLDEKLPGLLANAEGSLKNVEKISNDLKLAEEKVLPKVPSLMKKSEETLEGTNTVLHAVQGIWPISSHIPAPQEKQFVPGDSHD
jgi:phospholipid/cholesterol/gamma-HCH transport system substrate-binding protein